MTRRKSSDPHYWTRVRVRMYCALGGHDLEVGTWVRLRRDDHQRMARCEECLAMREVYRPVKPDDRITRDGKAEALGGDR